MAETAVALQEHILEALDDRKAQAVVTLDVSKVCSFTDNMVLASGTSNRHVKALVDHVVAAAKELGQDLLGVEGRETNEWVLIDLGDVVVHVMQAEARAFYDLERLWGELPDPEAEETDHETA